MGSDLSLPIDDGLVNIRVGAIIVKDNKLLMVGNDRIDYLYSVGGRIKFGETAEEAVVREVYEETGLHLKINRLGFIHENFFYSDSNAKMGKLVYEISYFFYMDVPKEFDLNSNSFTEDNVKEYLTWVGFDDERKMFPKFLKEELKNQVHYVKYLKTDDR